MRVKFQHRRDEQLAQILIRLKPEWKRFPASFRFDPYAMRRARQDGYVEVCERGWAPRWRLTESGARMATLLADVMR